MVDAPGRGSGGAAAPRRSGGARRTPRAAEIFLGYASGVGKSFRLFDEGRRRHERGEDVVVAATQPEMPPEVGAGRPRARDDSDARRRRRAGRSTSPPSCTRHPQVCLVDGLAYDNPPGSRHPKRYEDVEELLDAGISVLTSINLEYIAEQQDFVAERHWPTPRETVPQEFIDRADEVVVVDAPPERGDDDGDRMRAAARRSSASGRCC